MDEIHAFMKQEQLDIPLIAAGGVFTGSDAVTSGWHTGVKPVPSGW